MKTLKVLAILLSYPEESVHTNTKDLIEVLKEENLLPKKILKDLLVFIEDYKNEDFLELKLLMFSWDFPAHCIFMCVTTKQGCCCCTF
jgi:nitrate reductase assembly molybdenum cofactor insertion protein NarJ